MMPERLYKVTGLVRKTCGGFFLVTYGLQLQRPSARNEKLETLGGEADHEYKTRRLRRERGQQPAY